MSKSPVVHFDFDERTAPEPHQRWGKGYVVRNAETSIGHSEVVVDRAQLLARARERRRLHSADD